MKENTYEDAVLCRLIEIASIIKVNNASRGCAEIYECDRVLHKIENIIVTSKMEQRNKAIEVFCGLLERIDCRELLDLELKKLQILCLNMLNEFIEHGEQDAAEIILAKIGLGLIETQEMKIMQKESIVENAVIRLIQNYAKFASLSMIKAMSKENKPSAGLTHDTFGLINPKVYTIKAENLIDRLRKGYVARWLKDDDKYSLNLTNIFNQTIEENVLRCPKAVRQAFDKLSNGLKIVTNDKIELREQEEWET